MFRTTGIKLANSIRIRKQPRCCHISRAFLHDETKTISIPNTIAEQNRLLDKIANELSKGNAEQINYNKKLLLIRDWSNVWLFIIAMPLYFDYLKK